MWRRENMYWGVNRTWCEVLEEMRKADKTRNYSYLQGLIEELQTYGNRMESGLSDMKDLREGQEKRNELKKEIRELEKKKKLLTSEIATLEGKKVSELDEEDNEEV